MQVKYLDSAPLDPIGKYATGQGGGGDGFFRLFFVPQNPIGPDEWVLGNWSENMTNQLARIGKTPYFFPIQDPATIITDPKVGLIGVIDVQPRATVQDVPLEIALQAIDDSYPLAKLYQVEGHENAITEASAAARAADQAAEGMSARAAYNPTTFGAQLKSALGWILIAAVVVTIAIVASKAPNLSGVRPKVG
jgi:hypothetical protein